jgi:hypothetical protein
MITCLMISDEGELSFQRISWWDVCGLLKNVESNFCSFLRDAFRSYEGG